MMPNRATIIAMDASPSRHQATRPRILRKCCTRMMWRRQAFRIRRRPRRLLPPPRRVTRQQRRDADIPTIERGVCEAAARAWADAAGALAAGGGGAEPWVSGVARNPTGLADAPAAGKVDY